MKWLYDQKKKLRNSRYLLVVRMILLLPYLLLVYFS
jgi:hypothetical protein